MTETFLNMLYQVCMKLLMNFSCMHIVFYLQACNKVGMNTTRYINICTPLFLLNAPPSIFFRNSFSVTLRNFTNFITILIFLPQGYKSSRIMYLLFFSFRRSYENSRIAQKHLFSISATLRNFTDRASLLPFDF